MRHVKKAARERSIQFETLNYEVKDGVAFVELNRPQRLNAVNSVMSRELPLMWRVFDEDPSAIVAIVTGAGEKAFCTGADLGDLPEMITDDVGAPSIDSIRWTPLQNKVWKPVICAVNGSAVGGGLHFVAECDIVLASENANFSDPHVNVGLVSALEPIALARRMPMGAVLRMALVGGSEKLSAHDAQMIGMVSEVCAQSALIERAYDLSDRIKRNSPSAMAKTKRAIWSAKETGLHDASARGWEAIVAHNQTHDFAEGVKAFTEKRQPRWAAYVGEEDQKVVVCVMNEIRFDDIDAIKALISEEYGPWSAPLKVPQELITGFAELTGDRQWIHVDVERAKSESPFGSTIAHGFLILSLLPELRKTEGYKIVGHGNALNYGIDRLRFIRPAPVNSSLHCRSRFESVEVKNGGTMIELGVAIHVVGEDVPCVAFSWKLFYRP